MEQKDYLLREIEKIGLIIRYIWQKLFGGNENTSLTVEKKMNDVSEMLLNETGFDLNKFMLLNTQESNDYIVDFKGFSVENIELLADLMTQICFQRNSSDSKIYLEKALQLYELCNLKSSTYSLTRENKIDALKEAIKSNKN